MNKYICYARTKTGNKCKNRVLRHGDRCHVHSHVIIKQFYGFYPYPNFLLDDRLRVINLTNKITSSTRKLLKDSKAHFIEDDYELIIRNDGMILISINSINERVKNIYNLPSIEHDFRDSWHEYMEILNIVYLLFDVALISNTCNMSYPNYEFFELKKHDVFRVTYENNIALSSVSYGHDNKIRLALYDKLKKIDNYDFYIAVYDDRKYNFFNTYFKEVLNNQELFSLMNLLTKSISEYLLGNFNSSFILNWFYLESYYTNKWMNYINQINHDIEPNKPRFNRDRRKNLKNYSIASIIEQLEILNLITFEEYEELNELRTIRNKIIHKLSYRCSNPQANKIIKYISKHLNKEYCVNWTLNSHSHSITGL